MSVASSGNRKDYTGNGTQTAYSLPFLTYASAHVQVYLDNVLQSTGYTVTGVSDPGGVTVTFSVAPGSGVAITLLRTVPFTQLTSYPVAGAFPAKTAERDFDLVTMQCQQLNEITSRAFVIPAGSTFIGPVTAPDPALAANLGKVIRIKSDGTGLEAVSMVGSGSVTLPLPTADGGTGSAFGFQNLVYENDYASLSAAITAIGANVRTLLVNRTTTVTANLTIPTNVTLWALNAADISVSGAVTLTVNGPVMSLRGSPFSGAGTATVNGGRLYLGTSAGTEGQLVIRGVGPHAIGGATNPDYQFLLTGTFSPTTDVGIGFRIAPTINAVVNKNAVLLNVVGTLVEAASGTHADFVGVQLEPPTITPGAAALTSASTLKITGAPTGATNNYALWVASGDIRLGSSTAIRWGTGADGSITNSGTGNITITTPSAGNLLFNAQAGTERMRLTDGGILLLGHTISASASAADFVLNNNSWLRSGNGAGTDTLRLISLNTSNQLVLSQMVGLGDNARAVEVGATDSGGTGFRMMRVAN